MGKTFKVIGTKIYSFGLGGRFLFASVMTEKVLVPLPRCHNGGTSLPVALPGVPFLTLRGG